MIKIIVDISGINFDCLRKRMHSKWTAGNVVGNRKNHFIFGKNDKEKYTHTKQTNLIYLQICLQKIYQKALFQNVIQNLLKFNPVL